MTDPPFQNDVLYRASEIVRPNGKLPISASAFWKRIADTGKPPPLKLGPRTTAFSGADLNAMITEVSDDS